MRQRQHHHTDAFLDDWEEDYQYYRHGETKSGWLNFLGIGRNTYSTIVFTLVLIVAIQSYAPISAWLEMHRDFTWWECAVELYIGTIDNTRTYLQIFWEYARGIVFFWQPHHVAMQGPRQLLGRGPMILNATMPELERDDRTIVLPSSNYRIRSNELEPAFLNESDYPPGWMIYHPLLGVVSKEEADKFDRGETGKTTLKSLEPKPPRNGTKRSNAQTTATLSAAEQQQSVSSHRASPPRQSKERPPSVAQEPHRSMPVLRSIAATG